MFFVFGGLILFSSVTYYYKSYIFSIVLKYTLYVILNIIKIVSYFKQKKERSVKKIKTKDIQKFKMEQYEMVVNDKNHEIILIGYTSIELTYQFNELIRNVYDKLKYKNDIVYCSIIDDNGDIVIELTNIFRCFFYYFDKQDFKLWMFFDYIQDYIDEKAEIYKGIQIDNYNFMIYLNDDNFTELSYKIKEIKDKSINEILILK